MIQNSHCTQEIILKLRHFDQKALKKLTSLFLSNPDLFNGQSYQKQKVTGTSDQSLFRLQNKFRKISSLVMYFLTKFQKFYLQIYASQFMISQIIPLPFLLLNLESLE